MPGKSYTDVVIETVRDWLPTLQRESEEVGRESVQVVVWVVGLTSGLIVIAATNASFLARLQPGARRVFLVLLIASAILGIVHRVLYHIAEAKQRSVIQQVQGALVGLTANVDEPWELADWWDREEIVRRLKTHFDLDYEFLNEHNVPVEKAREIYSRLYQNWKSSEDQRAESFSEFLVAAAGQPKGTGRRYLGLDPPTGDRLERMRSNGISISRWRRASYALYFSTCATFVAALALVGFVLAR